jgi:hypothetical protein
VVPTGVTQTSGYVYYAYQTDIPPSNTLETHKFALNIGDRVYVRSTQNTSFNLAGLRQVDIQLATGVTSFQTTAPTNPINGQVWVDGDGVAGTNISSLAGYNVQASSATQIPFTVQGASGQTADLQQWDNSAGTALAKIDSTGLMYSQQSPVVSRDVFNVSGKNYIINGGFDIFQRTSLSTTTGAYGLDRWFQISSGSGAAVSVTQQTTGVPIGSRYCARITTAASAGYGNQYQWIETSNTSAMWGKTVTVSIKLRRSSAFAGTLSVVLSKSATIDGGISATWAPIASATATNAQLPTGTTSADWYIVSFTAAIPNDGTANSLQLSIQQSQVETSAYWEMAQAQLEIGSIASHFSRSAGTIQGELAACQRYYFRVNAFATSNYAIFGAGGGNSTTQARTIVPFPVTMRVKPTAIDYPTLGSNFTIIAYDDSINVAPTAAAIDSNQSDTQSGYILWTASSGVVANRPLVVRGLNSSGAYLGFSAEL